MTVDVRIDARIGATIVQAPLWFLVSHTGKGRAKKAICAVQLPVGSAWNNRTFSDAAPDVLRAFESSKSLDSAIMPAKVAGEKIRPSTASDSKSAPF